MRELALRAGFYPGGGVFGGGLELRLGAFGFGAGTGAYPLGLTASLRRPAGPGAFYFEFHGVWIAAGLAVLRPSAGFGLGATAGYDWRPWRHLSVQLGAGAAWVPERGVGLVVDLATGPVWTF